MTVPTTQTVDVSAWANGQQPELSLVTGSDLVVQRFLLELLTLKGSITYRPTRGTDFLTRLRNGSIHTELDIRAAFARSEAQIRSNLKHEESTTSPLNERYKKAVLASVSLFPGGCVLNIQLETMAGSVTLPVPISV